MDLLEEPRNTISDEDRVSVDGEVLERHGPVFSYHALLRFANRHGVPMVPYGEGSSLEGNALPFRDGISLKFPEPGRQGRFRVPSPAGPQPRWRTSASPARWRLCRCGAAR